MTLTEVLDKLGKDIVTDAKSILKRKNKYNTGTLYNSLSYKTTEKSLSFLMADYGTYVNDGRKPGKGIPVSVLEKWMKQRGIDLKYSFVINRKIREKGIKPTYFFTIAFNDNMANLDKMIDKYVDDLVLEIEFV